MIANFVLFLATVLLLAACKTSRPPSDLSALPSPTGSLRGYNAYRDHLVASFFRPGLENYQKEAFDLSKGLELTKALTGVSVEDAGIIRQVNVKPNGVNIALVSGMLSSFVNDLFSNCTGDKEPAWWPFVDDVVKLAVKNLCSAEENQLAPALTALWVAVYGSNASVNELLLEEWRAKSVASIRGVQDPKQKIALVKQSVLASLVTPQFLLSL